LTFELLPQRSVVHLLIKCKRINYQREIAGLRYPRRSPKTGHRWSPKKPAKWERTRDINPDGVYAP
jgi:hypothetical protein